MKLKILSGIAALVIAVLAAYNVNHGLKTNGLSDINLANVEALAQIEYDLPISSCGDVGCTPDLNYDCHVYLWSSGGFWFYGGTCHGMKG